MDQAEYEIEIRSAEHMNLRGAMGSTHEVIAEPRRGYLPSPVDRSCTIPSKYGDPSLEQSYSSHGFLR